MCRIPFLAVVGTFLMAEYGGLSDRREDDGQKANDGAPAEARSFELPKDQVVYCVGFFPDGRNVIAGTAGGDVWLWDTEKSKSSRRFKASSGHLLTGGVLSLAFSPDGKRLLLGCADGTVQLCDVVTGKEVLKFKGHRWPVWSVTFFKDGKRALCVSTSDYTIREWDLEKGKQLRQFTAQDRPDTLSLSPDEHFFVTPEFKTVQMWNLESGEVARTFSGHKSRVEGAFFTPDGKRIISASSGDVRVWNVQTGKCIRQFGDGSFFLESLAVSRDGRRVLLGGTNEMQLWDVATGRRLKQFNDLDGTLRVAFSPDGRYALSGEMWGRVRLWELPKPAKEKEPKD